MMAEGAQQNWRDGKTLVQCNRYMLEQEIGCDVRFNVGEDQRCVMAHKTILMARSDVFFAMFEGLLAEPNTLIAIPDIDPDTFRLLLLFVYCDEARVDLTDAFPLFYASQKYNLQLLVTRCGQRIRAGLSTETVCIILKNTVAWPDEEIKQLCLQHIFLHSSAVFRTDGFLDLSEECLKEILRHHKVNMKEEDIFTAVMKWTDERCRREGLEINVINKRRVLHNILPYIRFARMERSYFTDRVSHLGILTDQELLETFRFLNTNRADHPDPPRERRLVFERFSGVMCGKGYFRGNADAISFIMSHDTKLHEVMVYGSCQFNALYQVKFIVLEDGDNKLCEKNVELRTDGYIKTYPLAINPPLTLKRDVCYTLSMKMSGPASYYGRTGVSALTSDGVTITFLPNELGLNGTNIKQGQFSSLVLKKM